VEKTYADIRKVKKMLDWEAKTSLEKGLEKFVGWYRKNRV